MRQYTVHADVPVSPKPASGHQPKTDDPHLGSKKRNFDAFVEPTIDGEESAKSSQKRGKLVIDGPFAVPLTPGTTPQKKTGRAPITVIFTNIKITLSPDESGCQFSDCEYKKSNTLSHWGQSGSTT